MGEHRTSFEKSSSAFGCRKLLLEETLSRTGGLLPGLGGMSNFAKTKSLLAALQYQLKKERLVPDVSRVSPSLRKQARAEALPQP